MRAGLSPGGPEPDRDDPHLARPLPLRRLDPLPNPRRRRLRLPLRRAPAAPARRPAPPLRRRRRRPPADRPRAASTPPGRRPRRGRSRRPVRRPGAGKLVIALVPGAAGPRAPPLPLAGLSQRRRLRRRGRPAAARALPAQRLPHASACGRSARSAAPAAPPALDTNGPRERRVVALTFDDGPSEYTPGFLDVLRSKHVEATFFEIGQEMPGREADDAADPRAKAARSATTRCTTRPSRATPKSPASAP